MAWHSKDRRVWGSWLFGSMQLMRHRSRIARWLSAWWPSMINIACLFWPVSSVVWPYGKWTTYPLLECPQWAMGQCLEERPSREEVGCHFVRFLNSGCGTKVLSRRVSSPSYQRLSWNISASRKSTRSLAACSDDNRIRDARPRCTYLAVRLGVFVLENRV